MNRFRTEASEAHAASRHEQLRRKQLEEDLRRMLLKNMTAMNFEALSLFQHTTVPTPWEQQQTVGELKEMISSSVEAEISCIERERERENKPNSSTARDTTMTMTDTVCANTHMSFRSENSNPHSDNASSFDPQEDEGPRRAQPKPQAMVPPRPPLRENINIAESIRQGSGIKFTILSKGPPVPKGSVQRPLSVPLGRSPPTRKPSLPPR